ncbi:unnamed protein product [Dicrocoelium dendriticum]|nr:unnamed protein product [Dicrocoelium dendriticum]
MDPPGDYSTFWYTTCLESDQKQNMHAGLEEHMNSSKFGILNDCTKEEQRDSGCQVTADYPASLQSSLLQDLTSSLLNESSSGGEASVCSGGGWSQNNLQFPPPLAPLAATDESVSLTVLQPSTFTTDYSDNRLQRMHPFCIHSDGMRALTQNTTNMASGNDDPSTQAVIAGPIPSVCSTGLCYCKENMPTSLFKHERPMLEQLIQKEGAVSDWRIRTGQWNSCDVYGSPYAVNRAWPAMNQVHDLYQQRHTPNYLSHRSECCPNELRNLEYPGRDIRVLERNFVPSDPCVPSAMEMESNKIHGSSKAKWNPMRSWNSSASTFNYPSVNPARIQPYSVDPEEVTRQEWTLNMTGSQRDTAALVSPIPAATQYPSLSGTRTFATEFRRHRNHQKDTRTQTNLSLSNGATSQNALFTRGSQSSCSTLNSKKADNTTNGINPLVLQRLLPPVPKGGAIHWLNRAQPMFQSTCLISSTAAVDPEHHQHSSVSLRLRDVKIWQALWVHGTEMIATNTGRRVFPSLSVDVSGLHPTDKYIFALDMVLVQPHTYRHQGGQWLVSNQSEIERTLSGSVYVQEDSPKSGASWMETGVNFSRVKITNSKEQTKARMIHVHSMRRYIPRFNIFRIAANHGTLPGSRGCMTETTIGFQATRTTELELIGSYVVPGTQFYTVTAYQNPDVIRVKIDNNPFAKGFRNRQNTHELDGAMLTALGVPTSSC